MFNCVYFRIFWGGKKGSEFFSRFSQFASLHLGSVLLWVKNAIDEKKKRGWKRIKQIIIKKIFTAQQSDYERRKKSGRVKGCKKYEMNWIRVRWRNNKKEEKKKYEKKSQVINSSRGESRRKIALNEVWEDWRLSEWRKEKAKKNKNQNIKIREKSSWEFECFTLQKFHSSSFIRCKF